MGAADYSGFNTPRELSPAEMAVEYSILQSAKQSLDARLEALAVSMLATIKRGEHVPGYVARPGQGALKWAKPVPEVIALGRLLGMDLQKRLDAITPTQAKGRGLDLNVYRAFTEHFPGALKLAPDDRDAIAKRLFGRK